MEKIVNKIGDKIGRAIFLKEFDRLLSCLVEGNIPWAKNAPVLMLSVAALEFSRNGTTNRHAQHDVGLANENLVLQAQALGLVVHQMAGFDPQKARTLFDIPAGHDPLAMLAVGYQANPSDVPESLQAREQAPRSRKPLSQMVFTGKWGESSSLIP